MLNLDKNKKYLLACSCGPDSMALFSMLNKEGYSFSVAHVNYHFRKESDQEEALLREYCLNNNVDIYVYDNKEKVNKNLEARAREIRYNFFNNIYHDNNFDALLVAHHQDDLIETYLMQKKRDLHPNYFGIKEFSIYFGMHILRPLLSFSKNELLDYCNKNNVPYALDKSNDELIYERNKIRHEIIAHLSKDDRNNILKEIDEKNKELVSIISKLDSCNIHSAKTLLSLNKTEIIYAIQALANDCQIFKISKQNLNEIMKILSSKKPNVTLLYKSYSFIKEYDRVYFSNTDLDCSYLYVVNQGDELDTPYFYFDSRGDTSNRNVTKEDYPLVIRNALKGDKIKIKNYFKDVRRLFIDWKMPLSLRKRWPVIVNKDGVVIYIPRYRGDFVASKNLNFYVK